MKLIYYLIIKPISLFPLPCLYLLSDLLFLLSRMGVAYRSQIVKSNIGRAFPQYSKREKRDIEKRFYRHFYDLLAEGIRLFSIGKKEATRRFRVINAELPSKLLSKGRPVILTGGHYNNWELYAVAAPPQLTHTLYGIYTPLSNTFLETKFSKSRSRFGLRLIPKKMVKNSFEAVLGTPGIWTFAVDQCPRPHQRYVWTTFLGQPTAIHYGAEKYAREYNCPVIFGGAKKIRRGYYELSFQVITEDPQATKEGFISEAPTRLLEYQIKEQPEHWLWTHKRWKLEKTT